MAGVTFCMVIPDGRKAHPSVSTLYVMLVNIEARPLLYPIQINTRVPILALMHRKNRTRLILAQFYYAFA